MSKVNSLSLGSCPRCHAVLTEARLDAGIREMPPREMWRHFEPDPDQDVATLSCGCAFHGEDATRVWKAVRAAARASLEQP